MSTISSKSAAATYIDKQFETSVDIVQSLPKGVVQTGYEEKLLLYSLYKQASSGDVNSDRPGLLDPLGRAKWDAWKKRKGLSQTEAKAAYVRTLSKVLHKFSKHNEALQLMDKLKNIPRPSYIINEDESSDENDDEDDEEDDDEDNDERAEDDSQHLNYLTHSGTTYTLPVDSTTSFESSPDPRIPSSSLTSAELHARYRDTQASRPMHRAQGSLTPSQATAARLTGGYAQSISSAAVQPHHRPTESIAPSATPHYTNTPRGGGGNFPQVKSPSIGGSARQHARSPSVPAMTYMRPVPSQLMPVDSLTSPAHQQSAGNSSANNNNLERALDNITTSLTALHERMQMLESNRFGRSSPLYGLGISQTGLDDGDNTPMTTGIFSLLRQVLVVLKILDPVKRSSSSTLPSPGVRKRGRFYRCYVILGVFVLILKLLRRVLTDLMMVTLLISALAAYRKHGLKAIIPTWGRYLMKIGRSLQISN